MKKLINGRYIEMTETELSAMELAAKESLAAVSYDEAVDARIRLRYSASQEFAILRQKEEKPEEFAAYYAYCEECKALAKAQYQ